jgi:hypothetical protein
LDTVVKTVLRVLVLLAVMAAQELRVLEWLAEVAEQVLLLEVQVEQEVHTRFLLAR